MSIKNIIGKQVISVYDCQNCGFVLNINISAKFTKLTTITIVDETTDIIYKLNCKDILNITGDYIMIKNKDKLIVSADDINNNYFNATIIDTDGNSFGTINDVKYDKNYNILSILANKIEILPIQILTFNNEYILINNNSKILKKSHFAPRHKKIPQEDSQQTVEILPHQPTLPTPIRINSTASLLGKRLFRDLITPNGEVIARKNSVITVPLINTAKRFGIMTDLIQNIK